MMPYGHLHFVSPKERDRIIRELDTTWVVASLKDEFRRNHQPVPCAAELKFIALQRLHAARINLPPSSGVTDDEKRDSYLFFVTIGAPTNISH